MTSTEVFLLIFGTIGYLAAAWFGHRNVELAGENQRLHSDLRRQHAAVYDFRTRQRVK